MNGFSLWMGEKGWRRWGADFPVDKGRETLYSFPMAEKEKKEKANTAQDWMIISMFFWIVFVLIVTIGYLVDPGYTPPINP